jgi:hypothetical protein
MRQRFRGAHRYSSQDTTALRWAGGRF